MADSEGRSKTARLGLWLASGTELSAEVCALAGFDWLLIDDEHGPNDLRSILGQLRTIAAYPVDVFVRPGSVQPTYLNRLQDAGVNRFVIPMVESAAQAESLVRSLRYPMAGTRGVTGTLTRAAGWGLRADYLATADKRLEVIVQIETLRAFDEIDRIVAVDGVTGIFVGAVDLAASMGLIGQGGHPDVLALVDKAISVGVEAGKRVGLFALSPEAVERYRGAGASLLALGSDVTALAQATKNLAERYR